MVGPQTREALNKRARNAYVIMTNCAKILGDALREQTPPPPPPPPSRLPFPRGQRQPPETITLRGKEVQRMVEELYRYAEEMKRFTWPVKS